MTAQEFAATVNALCNNFTSGAINEVQFNHSIHDLLTGVIYNNDELKKYYFAESDKEAKSWEYQMMVQH